MSKITSIIVLLLTVGLISYYSGTILKKDLAEKNLAKPVMGTEEGYATQTVVATGTASMKSLK